MSKKHRKRKQRSVVRTDALDLDPNLKYKDLHWQMQDHEQDYPALHDQFKYDPIAHKIVAKPAEDAMRNGFRLVIPSDPNLQATYQKGLDDLKVQQEITSQVTYQREDGDGYLDYGVIETNKTDNFKPLDPQNIDDVAFVHAFGQLNVQGYRTNDDPTSADYGKESALVIRPKQAGYTVDRYGNQTPVTSDLQPVVIDASRYSHISLDKSDDDETGTSILTRCQRQLTNMAIADETVGKMLREFTLKLFQSDKLMSEPRDQFERDKREISQVANAEAMMFIGKDDNVTKLATPTSGIDVLLNHAWESLSTACDIPKSVLTGEQSGAVEGAGQDARNYYDTIKSLQEQVLKPEIMNVVRLLMYAKNFGGGYLDPDSLDWHIEFNPLWSDDDKTQSETLVNHANAAGTLVTNGIFAPDEVRAMFQGQGNNAVQGMQNIDANQDKPDQNSDDQNNGQNSDGTDPTAQYTPQEIEQYQKDVEKAGIDNGTS